MHTHLLPHPDMALLDLPRTAAGTVDFARAASEMVAFRATPKDTVRKANMKASERSEDAEIRSAALAICNAMGPPMVNVPAEAPPRICAWIRNNIMYLQETPGTEILSGPYRTLGNWREPDKGLSLGGHIWRGTGTGDCDDLALLFACLCRALGISAFLAGISLTRAPDGFLHAMGWCPSWNGAADGGTFYELSVDNTYGGIGDTMFSSVALGPDKCATVFDPITGRFSRVYDGRKAKRLGKAGQSQAIGQYRGQAGAQGYQPTSQRGTTMGAGPVPDTTQRLEAENARKSQITQTIRAKYGINLTEDKIPYTAIASDSGMSGFLSQYEASLRSGYSALQDRLVRELGIPKETLVIPLDVLEDPTRTENYVNAVKALLVYSIGKGTDPTLVAGAMRAGEFTWKIAKIAMGGGALGAALGGVAMSKVGLASANKIAGYVTSNATAQTALGAQIAPFVGGLMAMGAALYLQYEALQGFIGFMSARNCHIDAEFSRDELKGYVEPGTSIPTKCRDKIFENGASDETELQALYTLRNPTDKRYEQALRHFREQGREPSDASPGTRGLPHLPDLILEGYTGSDKERLRTFIHWKLREMIPHMNGTYGLKGTRRDWFHLAAWDNHRPPSGMTWAGGTTDDHRGVDALYHRTNPCPKMKLMEAQAVTARQMYRAFYKMSPSGRRFAFGSLLVQNLGKYGKCFNGIENLFSGTFEIEPSVMIEATHVPPRPFEMSKPVVSSTLTSRTPITWRPSTSASPPVVTTQAKKPSLLIPALAAGGLWYAARRFL